MHNLGPLNPYLQPAGPPVGYIVNQYLTLQADGYANTSLNLTKVSQSNFVLNSNGYTTTTLTLTVITKSTFIGIPNVFEGILSSEHDSDGYSIAFPNVQYGSLYSPHQTSSRQFFGRLNGTLNFNRNINIHALNNTKIGTISSEHIANEFENISHDSSLPVNQKLANTLNAYNEITGTISSEYIANIQNSIDNKSGFINSEYIANAKDNYLNNRGQISSEHLANNILHIDNANGSLSSEHAGNSFNLQDKLLGNLYSEHAANNLDVIDGYHGSVSSEYVADEISHHNKNQGTICSEHIGSISTILNRFSGILSTEATFGENYLATDVIEGWLASEHNGEVYVIPPVIEGVFRPKQADLELRSDGYATTSLILSTDKTHKLSLRSDGYATTSLILTKEDVILLESIINTDLDIIASLSQSYPIDRPPVDIDKMGKPLINGILPPGVYQEWANNKSKNNHNK